MALSATLGNESHINSAIDFSLKKEVLRSKHLLSKLPGTILTDYMKGS